MTDNSLAKMAHSTLPNPNEFDNLYSSEDEHFPKQLPERPGEKKPYLNTILRNNKFRIIICVVSFLAVIGGTVAAALFISRGMQSIKEGQAALSSTSPSSMVPTTTPTKLQSTVTKTNIITQTSVMTDHLSIPISKLQSTICAIATAPAASYVTCAPVDNGDQCRSAVSRPEKDAE